MNVTRAAQHFNSPRITTVFCFFFFFKAVNLKKKKTLEFNKKLAKTSLTVTSVTSWAQVFGFFFLYLSLPFY